ncbi:hypothetical protein HDU98_002335 [Podochytrium sp. JEL0797]|nr:hypothetical protein HDU98_002335 [Podochytrium sp. JEL0797]
MIGETPRYHTQPADVAALSLALLDSNDYTGLQTISSMYVVERLMALDSQMLEDKLSLFLWGNRTPEELTSIRLAIRTFVSRFAPLSGTSLFRKLDAETMHCAVEFDTESQLVVVLLKDHASWLFHDVRKSPGGNLWASSLEEAEVRWAEEDDEDAKEPLGEDAEYWESYLVSDVKTFVKPEPKAPTTEATEQDDDDDYWNSYDATAARF